MVWNNKIEEGMKRKARQLEYKDVLLSKCKSHSGPLSIWKN